MLRVLLLLLLACTIQALIQGNPTVTPLKPLRRRRGRYNVQVLIEFITLFPLVQAEIGVRILQNEPFEGQVQEFCKAVRKSGHRYTLREKRFFESTAEKKIRKHKNFIRKRNYYREGERFFRSMEVGDDGL